MYLRRHCYDKAARCPGWAGGGWRYPKVTRCVNGFLDIYNRPGRDEFSWRDHWRFSRCSRCDVRAIPVVTRWLDPTWLAWIIRRLPGDVREWWDFRKVRRERSKKR